MERKAGGGKLGIYARYELLTGEIMYPVLGYDGYGDGHNKDLSAFIGEQMQRDWHVHRADLMDFWAGRRDEREIWPELRPLPWLGLPRDHDAGQPWAAHVFDDEQ